MPAYYCGIFGHKPTAGVINTCGCTMRTGNEPSTMVVAGPMTRHAEDLMPLFKVFKRYHFVSIFINSIIFINKKVMAGPTNVKSLRLNEPVDVKKLKFYYIRQSGELRCSIVSGELQSVMTKCARQIICL